MLRVFAVIGLAAALSPAACAQARMRPEPSPQEKQVVADFEKRVNDSLALRKKEAGTSPAPTDSAEKLADTQKKLAAKVQQSRPNAKQGDIFTPEIADYFRKRIAATLQGEQGQKIRTSLKHAEPIKGIPLKVDSTYPENVPLQSTSPSLLLNLPRLPKELEYRIVDHDLVLHDTAANLIVDFMPHALPAS